MKNPRSIIAPAVAAACVMFTSHAAFAQSSTAEGTVVNAAYIENLGPTERINYSGKLRMLSQRIPSAACHLAAGIEGSREILEAAEHEFHDILAALEFGNSDMGIHGAETRKKTVMKIHDVHNVWDPYEKNVDEVLAGAVDDAHVSFLLTESMTVLGSAKLLVSEISGQYSNPAEMTQAGAMVVDISGRQRMLTQKMAKEACAAWSERSETAANDLAGTMQVFETSLTALIDGFPAAGIKRPPTKEIAAGLQVVRKDWAEVEAELASVAAGEKIDDAKAAHIFNTLNRTLVNMNKVVMMYAAAERIELG